MQYFLLRWGHALVWLLLAASCFLRGMSQPGLGDLIALAAGLCYLAFLGSLITTRPA